MNGPSSSRKFVQRMSDRAGGSFVADVGVPRQITFKCDTQAFVSFGVFYGDPPTIKEISTSGIFLLWVKSTARVFWGLSETPHCSAHFVNLSFAFCIWLRMFFRSLPWMISVPSSVKPMQRTLPLVISAVEDQNRCFKAKPPWGHPILIEIFLAMLFGSNVLVLFWR